MYGKYPFPNLQPSLQGYTNNVADLKTLLKGFLSTVTTTQVGLASRAELVSAYGAC